MEWKWAIKAVVWAVKLARRLRAQRLLARLRDRAVFGVLHPLHLDVLHAMRGLAVHMMAWGEYDEAGELASRICTGCRKVMGTLLELKPNELHCCLKVMAPRGDASDPDRVATWMRSEPYDDRPIEIGNANAHLVGTNTVWCALFGRSDGITNWRPFTCFACNDLAERVDLFKCDRETWARYYRSTLVFPLRYISANSGMAYENIGFLAFDSPRVGAFAGLPDIFEYRDRLTEYQDLLENSSVFHLGAILADTLSALLRRCYQDRLLHQNMEVHHAGAEDQRDAAVDSDHP